MKHTRPVRFDTEPDAPGTATVLATRGVRRRSALLAATFAVTLLAACGREADQKAGQAAEETPLAVGQESLYRVEVAHLSSGPAISGSLEPVREATVRAEVAGPVRAAAVEEGQAVAAGAVLGRIDDSGLRDALLSAESAVRSADQQLTVARRNAERADALVAGGAIPEREAESARWNVTNAQAQLADARSRLTLAREQLGKTIVHAPFAGVVSKRHVTVGDTVQPGSDLFTIVDPTRMRLAAQVPAERLAELQVGTRVDFTIAGLPARHQGVIERINPVVDPSTRQVEIHVSLPNDAGRLVGGLYAEGRVAAAARDVLAVPTTAIDRGTGAAGVLRVAGGKVERVPVELGMTDEESEKVEVKSGLAAGDLLLIGAARGITPGARVDIREAPRAAAGAADGASRGSAAAQGG
jgi:membrane fusion protein, multidrug efflux system